MKYVIPVALIAMVLSAGLIPFVIRFAREHGFMAPVGGRRINDHPVPLLGGAAICVGFLAAVAVALWVFPEFGMTSTVAGVLVSAFIVALGGVIDDKYELSGGVQLAIIIFAACVLTFFFGVKAGFINRPWPISMGWAAAPVTAIWIVMVTKAFDCIDGLDGLAGGIAVISGIAIIIMALMAGRTTTAILEAALVGGTLGFLFFNLPPAKIFMGTVGSQFLGFMLAAIPIAEALKSATLVAVFSAVLPAILPVVDTSRVVAGRIKDHKNIGQADKTHLHHKLRDMGFTDWKILALVYGINIILCVIAVILFKMSLGK